MPRFVCVIGSTASGKSYFIGHSFHDDEYEFLNIYGRQRRLLEKYAADNGFENILFLADDGYSGTNFDRPSWKKIVGMIENDEVGTLLVKDDYVI